MANTLVICPFCDNEERVKEERHVIRCGRCGKPFNADPFNHQHPEEFWENPDTSARF